MILNMNMLHMKNIKTIYENIMFKKRFYIKFKKSVPSIVGGHFSLYKRENRVSTSSRHWWKRYHQVPQLPQNTHYCMCHRSPSGRTLCHMDIHECNQQRKVSFPWDKAHQCNRNNCCHMAYHGTELQEFRRTYSLHLEWA